MVNWKQNEEFCQISPEKQQMIELLAENLEGRNLTEALPIITQWKKQMQQKNLQLTPREDKIITDILSRQLTPAQRKQFETLQQFIGRQKRRGG
jgi:hypothetical protein